MSGRPAGATTGRLAGWLGLVLALTALNYGSRLAAGDAAVDRDAFYDWSLAAGTVVQFGIMLALTLWIVAGGPAGSLLALRRPESWGTAAAISFGVFVAVLALGYALEPTLDAGEEQGLTPEQWRPERAGVFAVNFALTTTFVPVVEELLFRGAGVSLLLRFGPALAVVATGVLFGLAHGLVRALPILVAFGIGLAILRVRTTSVYPCVVLHGVFNAVSLLVAVFGSGLDPGS